MLNIKYITFTMDNDTYKIYNLIKISICKYIVTPLKCTKEDILQLSNEIV